MFSDIFHGHIPKHRINDDDLLHMMKALILRAEEAPSEKILHSYLNLRRGAPARITQFVVHVEYPEPGVIRKYCGTNTVAWVDTVINPKKFRLAPSA
jgi:hypothetical protein